jgi:hypothetical protein
MKDLISKEGKVMNAVRVGRRKYTAFAFPRHVLSFFELREPGDKLEPWKVHMVRWWEKESLFVCS